MPVRVEVSDESGRATYARDDLKPLRRRSQRLVPVLFVLWTRDASGVGGLPIGSRDRRDMQVIGRRIMEA